MLSSVSVSPSLPKEPRKDLNPHPVGPVNKNKIRSVFDQSLVWPKSAPKPFFTSVSSFEHRHSLLTFSSQLVSMNYLTEVIAPNLE